MVSHLLTKNKKLPVKEQLRLLKIAYNKQQEEKAIQEFMNLLDQDLYTLTEGQKKDVSPEAKETLRDLLESGEQQSIREIDHENYDQKFDCKIAEVEIESHYSTILQTYRYDPQNFTNNLQNFMECMREKAEPRVGQFYMNNGQMKFFLGFQILFENANGDHVNASFVSGLRRIHNLSQIDEKYESIIEEIWRQVDEFNRGGSGQYIARILSGYLNMGLENPAYKSKGRSYIPVPEEYKNQKGLCNVVNNDNECFKWSVLACIHPQGKNGTRQSKYEEYKDELKFPEGYNKEKGFEYEGNEVKKFEDLNNIAINIYGKTRKNGVYPLRISQRKLEDQKEANLWYIEDETNKHYVAITNFNTFMAKSGRQMYYCQSCLNGFTSKEILGKHRSGPLCIKEGDSPTKIILPKKDTGDMIVEFKKSSNWKEMEYPVVIYADTESLLVKPIDTRDFIKNFPKKFGDEMQSQNDDKGRKIKSSNIYNIICDYAGINTCDVKSGETIKYESHEISSFCYHIVYEKEFAKQNGLKNETMLYRGCDAGLVMLQKLLSKARYLQSLIKYTKTISDDGTYKKVRNEKYKDIPAMQIKIPIFLHNLKGYDAHHILLELAKACNTIPGNIGKDGKSRTQRKDVKCIPISGEKFVSFEAMGLVFKDSMSFLGDSLGNLANNLKLEVKEGMEFKSDEDRCEYVTKLFTETRGFYRENMNSYNRTSNKYSYTYKRINELTVKGSYPYSYFDSFDRFKEDVMPAPINFCSSLDECTILGKDGPIVFNKPDEKNKYANEQYKKACMLYNEFKCKNLGEYNDLYLRTDTLILADIFESFRNIARKAYELDPVTYYTLPGYSWEALLKKSKVRLELFTEDQFDMLLFTEAQVKGGISMIPNRFGRGKNIYTEPELRREEHKGKLGTFIVYYDANGLYSSAMCNCLPVGGYRWVDELEYKTVLDRMTKNKMSGQEEDGYTFEVDMHIPEELHDTNNDYPCAPESLEVTNEMLSPYARKLKMDIINLQRKRTGRKEIKMLSNSTNCEKLICRLTEKKNYIVNYMTLQKYIELGMIVTKVHRVLSFKQSPWMKSFIEKNIEMRKAAKNDFENVFYKLMNNAVFGKTMENVRKRKDVELIVDKEVLQKKLNSYKHGTWDEIKGGLVIMNLHKEEMRMNKPIAVGAAILDISKIMMYDFHYNVMKKKYKDRARLLFTDTDSLCYEIKTNNYYRDALEDINILSKLDTSAYAKIKESDCKYRYAMYNHPIYGGKATKGVLGKFKDETPLDIPVEFVGLRAKMYSLLMMSGKEKGTAKGVKKKAKEVLKHEYYRKCLFGENYKDTLMKLSGKFEDRCQMIKFNVIRSHKHKLYSETVTKVSLCGADDKFYQLSDTEKLAYGHWRINKK